MEIQHETITDALEALAERQPAAPALHVPGRKSLTYADLAGQIRRVRERLSDWGILPGDVVAAVIPSRPEMAVAIATLPSSCTFAPLDPTLMIEAYVALLTRLQPKAVLVPEDDQHAIRGAARRLGIAEIEVEAVPDAPAGVFALALRHAGPALAAGNSPDPEFAYILTSSGTGGRRKLVPAEHRAMLLYARAMRDWLEFSPQDVGVHLVPMYFGHGLRSGLVNGLLAGRSTVCLPEADIEAFFASIEEFRPTFFTAGFSLFRGILRRAPEFRAAVAQNRFRFMRSGSGRLDPDDADRLEQLFGAPMLTGLSSTETSRISHDPLPPRRRKRGSVGLPVVNEVALLDGAGNIFPAGGPGEIVVRGPTVFRGYLDDPELNAASFIGEWFRTGDLGRIDEDGYVYVSGRIKEIINRGGEKISPVEIDLAIESLRGVKEAAAFAVPHPTLGEEMVAAVVREENAAIDEAAVVEQVRARAGPRKVPRRVYFVASLPRTDNGKLRRSALPELLSLEHAAESPSPVPGAERAASLSPLEAALAGLWSSLLHVAEVGRDDDFFLRGGDSLRGTQLLAHVKALFGVDIPIQSLFGEAATVAGMARAIEAIRAGESTADRRSAVALGQAAEPALRPRRRDGPVVLTHTQRRAWFLARLDPGSAAYNESRAQRLSGPIDIEALQNSLRTVIERHEIFRTTYALVDDEPRQIIHAAPTLDFRCLDLSANATDERAGALLGLIDAEGQAPFDLERGPFARFRLIRLANDEYVLLRVWHHIVSDGWSAWVFERELSAAYNARVTGRAVELPQLPLQYADYALWQREWLAGVELERQLSYWSEQLEDLATLELPTDRRRPAVQSYSGARLDVELAPALVRDLRALASTEGATLFMAGLAAFQVLLHRYSGAEDIAVGTPIAGRRRAELEGLIGFFANTLVLRGSLAGEPTFRELLARVREAALAAYAHQDLPFEKLVEALAPVRDLSRNPLFQVCFALQNAPGTTLALSGLQVSRVGLPTRSAKFDLTLTLRETEQGLRASWEYCTDLFEQATIERMAGHFQVLLESIVAEPGQRIGQLALMSAAERDRLLVQWNDTAAEYPRDRCIHELFEAQAAATPDAPALLHEGAALSYAELNARANQLAHYLRARGMGPNALVCVCLERGFDLMVSLLGILKAGGAYVPLDPDLPTERLAFMLEDTAAALLIAQQGLLARLPRTRALVLCVDRDWRDIATHRSTNPATGATPRDLAYVMYTSGSTGKPKGACIAHRGVVNYLSWAIEAYRVKSAAAIPVMSSIAFDLTVTSLFAPLLAGRTVHLLPQAQGIESLGEALLESGIDYGLLMLSPAHLPILQEQAKPGRAGRFARALIVGGEQLVGESIEFWRTHAPETVIINEYGPTETVVACSAYTVTSATPTSGPIPIGRPIANTRIYLLDRRGEPVPVGAAGELHIAGDGVGLGYWRRPELTAKRFVPDPFAAEPAAKMYRTGDLGRYLPDGNIEFLGRLDTQVKLRGFRIELGEIEAVIAEHPAVREVAVLAHEDSVHGKRLVAYVVAAETPLLSLESMRVWLQKRLPDYMVPTALVVLDRFPLMPNGKVDRRALPAPQRDQNDAGKTLAVPGESLDALVVDVWREALGRDSIGAHDDFFRLGGHSLLATRVVARLSSLCGVDLPLRRIFELPTVAGLAAEIERLRGAADVERPSPIERVQRQGAMPLSFAQQRLWFIDRLRPGSAAYNIRSAQRLLGTLSIDALRRSLDAVVARHESLRTTFALINGEPRQIIGAPEPVEMAIIDVSDVPESERHARALALVDEQAKRPFDLAIGPVLRAALLRLGPQEHVLLICVHHIVSDGWSAWVFERELSVAYGALVAGRALELPELALQYADYAVWQREWLTGEVLERQLGYWKEQLAELPTLELPTDRTRPPVQSYRGARYEMELPVALVTGVKALGRAEGATLFMTGLAAFQVLLHRYSGAEDIAVGTPIAGRRRVELEGLIGFFANTLVLRVDLSGEPAFRKVLARVRSIALSAYTHQDVPFEKLVEELAPARDPSRNPLFQVCFALQSTPGATLALAGLEVSRLALPTSNAKFDLTLTLRDSGEGLRASWDYCTDLFERTTIERMAGHFRVLLEAIVAEPGQSIGRLGLLGAAERHQLLVEWNRTAADYPRDRCIHELFEAQAARAPQATAVLHEGATLTYAELNARANQLAHYLRAAGVGPQALVGICLERGLGLMVGLLGILKTGAAYVPLDPDLPRERLAFMLQDTAAAVLITQQGLLGRLPQTARHQLCLDRDWHEIAAHGTVNLASTTSPRDLAYVMYTSGSTGRPKGVAIRQEGIIRLVREPNYVSLSPADAIAQVSNVAFDAATFEIWGALLNGARLVILARDVTLSPASFAEALAAHRISCVFLTTALFNRISVERPDAFRTLRYLLFGGETCDPDRVKDVLNAGGPRHLLHVYGPTETTTFATFHEVRQVESNRTIPIGRPISATEVFLLDSRGEAVPIGATGEIYIGGPGVAAGYIGHPEETNARFVGHPLRRESGERVYRTGDLARRRADGSIEFLGRNDAQVKIRGFRIEPSEISVTLNAHPGVQTSYVIARPRASGEVGLVAYFVVRESRRDPVHAAELRRFLSSRLPAYMVPLSFIQVPSLPLTPNGKVDHRALPDPLSDGVPASREYVTPGDEIERVMCRIWAEVLGIDRVGLDDNFFEIGGHSLLAARLFARLDEALGRLLPLGVLFTSPTVRALAEHYRAAPEPTGPSALVPLITGGSLPAIFAVPGIFGDVVHVAHLARELGPSQPFYGLQSLGLDGREVPLDSIEAMATRYLTEVRTVQPHGPYVLIGVCFGGTVAYEMARQLLVAGEEVAFLGLLDPTRREGDEASERPRSTSRALMRAETLGTFLIDRLRLYREEMRSLGYRDRIKYVTRKLIMLGSSIAERDRLNGVQREIYQRGVYRANLQALDRYERKALTGRLRTLEVFETTRPGREGKRDPFNWSALWEGHTVPHFVPGKDSGDMLKGENVRVVATLLVDRLRLAHGR